MGITYSQKCGAFKACFAFEQELIYTFDNGLTKVAGTIPYHKVPDRTTYREDKNWRLKYAAVFSGIFCALVLPTFMDTHNIAQILTILYGVVLTFLFCSLLSLRSRGGGITHFSASPMISILHDGKEQVILKEIFKRRHTELKRKLSEIDFNRPYYEEAGKFSWLREESVITEDEYRLARHKIAAMKDKMGQAFSGPGILN